MTNRFDWGGGKDFSIIISIVKVDQIYHKDLAVALRRLLTAVRNTTPPDDAQTAPDVGSSGSPYM